MLQIRNLTKIYDGGVKALDNVSFDVPKGQFLAVIGLSGSGKSTLLRCINRLIDPTAGQILWDGRYHGGLTRGNAAHSTAYWHGVPAFQPGPSLESNHQCISRQAGLCESGMESL